MAKVFVEFEGQAIDINNIKFIDRDHVWNDKEEKIMYRLIINNPNRIKVDSFYPVYSFEYCTEELRDKKYDDLKMILIEEDYDFLE